MKDDNPTYSVDPTLALAIIYIVFAVSNFIAPIVVGQLGARVSMVIGAVAYA